MCTHLAADRSTLILTLPEQKGRGKKNKTKLCFIVPPLLIGYFSQPLFPCPAIFSQVLIFSFCQARSRQPPRYFQRSGLHANCPSMARLPPTYIMHLVSSAQPGPHHPGLIQIQEGIASGFTAAKQIPTRRLENNLLPCFWAENFDETAVTVQFTRQRRHSFTFSRSICPALFRSSPVAVKRRKGGGAGSETRIQDIQVKRECCRGKAHIDCANCVHVDPRLAVFLWLQRFQAGLRRQPCTINIYSSPHALIFAEREGGRAVREHWGRKMRKKHHQQFKCTQLLDHK